MVRQWLEVPSTQYPIFEASGSTVRWKVIGYLPSLMVFPLFAEHAELSLGDGLFFGGFELWQFAGKRIDAMSSSFLNHWGLVQALAAPEKSMRGVLAAMLRLQHRLQIVACQSGEFLERPPAWQHHYIL